MAGSCSTRVRNLVSAARSSSSVRFRSMATLATHRSQEFKLVLGISISVLVVLRDQHSDSFFWCLKGHAQPSGPGRAHELDFTFLGQSIKEFLRDNHWAPRAKYVSRAAPCQLLGRWWCIELIHEKGKSK